MDLPPLFNQEVFVNLMEAWQTLRSRIFSDTTMNGYIRLCAVVIFLMAFLNIQTAFGTNRRLEIADPVTTLSSRNTLLFFGIVEFGLTFFLLNFRVLAPVRMMAVFWISINLGFYRVGLFCLNASWPSWQFTFGGYQNEVKYGLLAVLLLGSCVLLPFSLNNCRRNSDLPAN